MTLENNMVIICNNEIKEQLISSTNELLDIKYLTLNELRKKYLYDYDSKAINYLNKKYGYKIDICKMYLDNTYYVEDKVYNNKLDFLVQLKHELKEYFIYDDLFINSIKNRKIIVYGYDYIDPLDIKILTELNATIISKEHNKYIPKLYKFNTIEDEINFVAHSICKLIDSGIDINNIKLANYSNEYENLVKRIFGFYNIPISLTKYSLYSLEIGNIFVKYYDSDINKTLEVLNSRFDSYYVNKIVNILNNYSYINDYDEVYDNIINDLKNTFVTVNYKNEINIVDYNNVSDNDYVFLIDFTKNTIPKVVKDEDYITDNIKGQIGMDSTIIINKQIKESTIKNLFNIKNLVITYKLKNNKTKYYPSNLIEEMSLTLSDANNDNISYSELFDKVSLCTKIDNLFKYGSKDTTLDVLANNYTINYNKYDNKFDNIKNINKYVKYLTLSYSSLSTYNECPFKYYMSNIIKADKFEDNQAAIIGTIFHRVLELGLKQDIDIDTVINDCIKEHNYELDKKAMFYINKLKPNMEYVLNRTKEHLNHCKLDNILTEQEFSYDMSRNIKIIFKGYIDKILYKKFDNTFVVALFDYKTYDTSIDFNLVSQGLNMQLPIYLYLVKNNKQFTNVKFAGFYIYPVMPKIPEISDKKSYDQIYNDNLKFNGISNSDQNILELLDDTYNDSEFIKGIKTNKDGSFGVLTSKRVKSDVEIDEIINFAEQQINKCIDNICNGIFTIKPKIYKKDNISCKYCKFKDTCFKTKRDEFNIDKLLGGDTDEVDN